MTPAPLADAADLAAWRAAQDAAHRAAPGYRQQARRRLARVTNDLLRRDVQAAREGQRDAR